MSYNETSSCAQQSGDFKSRDNSWRTWCWILQLDYTQHSTKNLAALSSDEPAQELHDTRASKTQAPKPEFETVGCVVVDYQGHCAAATSTGGLVNKMLGRIGNLVPPTTPVMQFGAIQLLNDFQDLAWYGCLLLYPRGCSRYSVKLWIHYE